MKVAYLLAIALSACTTSVTEDRDFDEDPPHAPAPGTEGMPCVYLHGYATLTDYVAYDNYASSAFSFEFASQDPEVTYNEFDLLYDGNMFRVNTVTDDVSFIVDLGNVPLDEAPAMVDPDDYPLGNWGEHDNIQAYLDHSYFARNVDGAGRGVSAFRVVGLRPGVDVQIEWIHSVAPDTLIIPTQCL